MWKNIDAFAKPREDLRNRSALGGIIAVVAACAAALLFLGQMYAYVVGVTRHSLHLSESYSVPVPKLEDIGFRGRLPLKIYISFPELECQQLDLVHDGMSPLDSKFRKIHGSSTSISKRPMSIAEYQKVFGEKGRDYSKTCTIQAEYDVP